MRKLICIVLSLVLAGALLTGCLVKKDEAKIQTGQSILEGEIITDQYRAQHSDNYRLDTPILIDSYSSWSNFLAQHPQQSTTEDQLGQSYNAEFFNNNVIYAYVKEEYSGSFKLTAMGLEQKDGNLNLMMKRSVPPADVDITDDMAIRICLFAIAREDIKGVKSVQGAIEEVVE